jgi:hypothetical protein
LKPFDPDLPSDPLDEAQAFTHPPGRPPLWPQPWISLAESCGGSSILRAHLGLKSKTSLSAKINGTQPWRRDEVLTLAGLCRVHGFRLPDLLDPLLVCSVLVLGFGTMAAPRAKG